VFFSAKYMGCYNAFYGRDINGWRDMSNDVSYVDYLSNTQEKCFHFCFKNGFSYAGLYNG